MLTDNALRENAVWFLTPAHRAGLRQTPRAPISGTNAAAYPKFVIDDDGRLLGYRVFVKTTSVTNAKSLFFVPDEVVVGVWNMMSLKRDEATSADTGTVYIRSWVDMDVAVKHLASICVASGN